METSCNPCGSIRSLRICDSSPEARTARIERGSPVTFYIEGRCSYLTLSTVYSKTEYTIDGKDAVFACSCIGQNRLPKATAMLWPGAQH